MVQSQGSQASEHFVLPQSHGDEARLQAENKLEKRLEKGWDLAVNMLLLLLKVLKLQLGQGGNLRYLPSRQGSWVLRILCLGQGFVVAFH